MKPEDRFLFLATRQNVTEGDAQAMKTLAGACHLGWNAIFWAAEKNGVAPLVFVNISRLPELSSQVPEEILDHYDDFGVTHCQCRQSMDLTGRGCGKPACTRVLFSSTE